MSLVDLYNCGSKTVGDILRIQSELKDLIACYSGQGRSITVRELLERLAESRKGSSATDALVDHARPPTIASAPPVPQPACSQVVLADDEARPRGTIRLFHTVLDALGTRARNVLVCNEIQDLERFLSLESGEIRLFHNSGEKTTAEVLEMQSSVKSILADYSANGQEPTFDKRALISFIHKTHQLAARTLQEPTPVERRIDDPSFWSVLRRTIPDLFRLNAESREAILDVASQWSLSRLNIPPEDIARLAAAAIFEDDTLDVLLFLSISYFVELEITPKTFEIIIDEFKLLYESCTKERCPDTGAFVASADVVVTEPEVATIRTFRVDSFGAPQELLWRLHQEGLVAWGDLTGMTESAILTSYGLSLAAFYHMHDLWQMKRYAHEASMRVSGLPLECFASFDSMMRAFIDLVAKSSRQKTVLLGRLGLLDNRKWTLDDLGNLLGLTRERVRQIERKELKTLKSPSKMTKLARLWTAVDETLRIAGGACLIGELAEQVANKLEWEQKPNYKAFASLLRLREDITIDKVEGLVCDPQHRCFECDIAAFCLEDLFAEDKSERPLSDVIRDLLSECAAIDECAEYAASLALSEGFVILTSKQTESVLTEDGVVYSRNTWASRRGSRVQMVESILKNAGRPMHFSEVYLEAKQLLQDDKRLEHNVYSWLGRSDNLLRWDTCRRRR